MCAKNKEILERIAELADNGVFEIWYPGILNDNENRERTDIYIPYMMNDALECYFILKNAVLVGKQLADQKQYTTVEIHTEGERYVLVAKQGKENVFTVFFQDVVMEKKYYRFDSICHFWEPGQEQWSQLVYIIGTMYDKYAFLGEKACNEEEKDLLDLIEFAPFRYHAPAKQLFEELYDNTKKGTQKMLELSQKAGDFGYYVAVKLYQLFPCEWLAGRLSRMLTKPQRYGLYCYIYERAVKGASRYPERVYPKETGFDINLMRKNLDERFKKNGFTGQYPDYVRGSLFVRTVEEHPFTVMDWEDFTLQQTLMVSECTGKYKGINMGFFNGKNLKGYYCSADELLEG
ncbi:MAG: DUF3878 family protein [Thermoflexaceae bacterium]|nr:DUF3878 family protein [Thermoflexaceae bacterium]